ncbi:cytochrome b [Neptunomonas sp.]|uniref:cytochrome b n=1 Tax=Neptunomonas sp. TaxID=1971898 RepID=UPI0025DE098A|nr:cytochrome b [Neptunomonas sp.]
MDTLSRFSKHTISLHWLIAFAMIGSLAFGVYLEEMPRSADKGLLMGIHKSVGVFILLFALYRIVHRLRNKLPPPVTITPLWQQKFANLAHIFLLAGTVFMPVSGIFMSIGGGYPITVFGLELIPAGEGNELIANIGGAIHGLGAKLLILTVVLHVLGTLKHHFIDKDGTLKRMLGARV